MSGGYTPLFASIVTGTLYGRWPDIGLWPIVLAIADRHGLVDVTPHYLAGATGLPVDEVIACMKRFCEPDPYSRSKADGGSRLTLLDDHRDWGWQIVNHSKYREKARKASYDSQRTESGLDAERKRIERSPDASRVVPTPPAMTRAIPLSDSDSDSDSDNNQEMSGKPDPSPAKPLNGEAVHAVFSHWQTVWGHPQAKLDPKRKATITAALKLGYDTETLCQAISGYQNSAHHTGKNERLTVYDDIGLFLRDAEHIDAGLGHLKNPNKEKPKWV